jgi:hypothetical protein
MAEFRQGVITTRGLDLLARAQAGTANITFTKAMIGNGEWAADTPQETIMAAIALRNARAEFPVASAEFVNDATSLLTIIASNVNNNSGYYITEVGVYATDGNTEILYAMYIAIEADWFPAFNSVTPFSVTYNSYITVANAANVTVSISGGSLVTRQDLADAVHLIHTDAEGYVGLMINAIRQNKWETDERLDELDKSNAQEVGTVTLTNTLNFPFNDSQISVALTNVRDNLNYIVEVISVTATGGPAGEIEVSDRQVNGFKIAFTGSASSVQVTYAVIGGYDA